MLTFLLPKNIKRFDYEDDAFEKEVLIQRNVQFTIESKYRLIDGIKIFDAVISLYEPPVINKDLVKRSSKELDILMIGEAWKNELPAKFTAEMIDQLIEKRSVLNFEPEVYKMIKTMLMLYAKTS